MKEQILYELKYEYRVISWQVRVECSKHILSGGIYPSFHGWIERCSLVDEHNVVYRLIIVRDTSIV